VDLAIASGARLAYDLEMEPIACNSTSGTTKGVHLKK